jgi:hypothetical protein
VLRNGQITDDMEAFENPQPAQRAVLPKVIEVSVGSLKVPVDPRFIYVEVAGGRVFLSVPLRNVGRGLAVIDDEHIESIDGDVSDVSVARPRVPPGETTRVSCVLHLADEAPLTSIALVVPYGDFAKGQRTRAVVYIDQEPANGEWRVGHVDQAFPSDD